MKYVKRNHFIDLCRLEKSNATLKGVVFISGYHRRLCVTSRGL